MSLKQFRRIRTDRDDVKQLQDATAATFQSITQKEILDGRLIEDVLVSGTGTTTVEHKLGRELLGYIVVRLSDEATVWDSQRVNPIPSKTLILNASVNVTLSLWVF